MLSQIFWLALSADVQAGLKLAITRALRRLTISDNVLCAPAAQARFTV